VYCLSIIPNHNVKTKCYVLFIICQSRLNSARLAVTGRAQRVATVVDTLEREMELLCVTGVEDKLQVNVRRTLELLGNAGIKVRVILIKYKCLLNKFIFH